jgi:hypothetical protein
MTPPDNYTSASGALYTFHNMPLGFDDALAVCVAQCGHLATYFNLPEQNDVEQYYVSNVGAGSILAGITAGRHAVLCAHNGRC